MPYATDMMMLPAILNSTAQSSKYWNTFGHPLSQMIHNVGWVSEKAPKEFVTCRKLLRLIVSCSGDIECLVE
jgi:hypothetical protein